MDTYGHLSLHGHIQDPSFSWQSSIYFPHSEIWPRIQNLPPSLSMGLEEPSVSETWFSQL